METAVVTGAGRGIGLELTAQLCRRGTRVIATVRDDAGETRLRSVMTPTTPIDICRLDVTDEDAAEKVLVALEDAAVDVLVNNAGAMGPSEQTIDAMDYAAWASLLEVNVLAPFRMTTGLLPRLRASRRPRVVTLSSIMGCLHRQSVGAYAYRSSKAAVNKVMRVLAHELAGERIIVCPVHPGWVQTDMGGPDAELSVAQSARGLIALIDRLTVEDSGRFWQWDGTELDW